jgi:signal transduction histidine kinase
VTVRGTGLVAGRDDPPATHLKDNGGPQLTGAGLRLAIVRHLAQQMNGDIKLLPSPQGTALVVKFGGLRSNVHK